MNILTQVPPVVNLYECQPCGVKLELTPADKYGEDPAECKCGRFFTPFAPAFKPLFDLLICSRRVDVEGRIQWLKFAGEAQARPALADVEISSGIIQELLQSYELVATERHPYQIIRKYRRVAQ